MLLPEWLDSVRRRMFSQSVSRLTRGRLSRIRDQRRASPSNVAAYVEVFEERVLLSAIDNETLMNATVAGQQQFSGQSDRSFAVTDEGDLILAWTETAGSSAPRILARQVDSAGSPLGGEIEVSATSATSSGSTVVGTYGHVHFVVVWESTGNALDGDGSGVFARLFSGDGTPVGAEFRVNESTTGDQGDPSVAWISTDKFVVAWSGSGTGDAQGVFTRVFDATGQALTSERQVSDLPSGPQREPVVVSLANVHYQVVWSGEGDGDTSGIFSRSFDSTGQGLGTEFRVNGPTDGIQQAPAMGRNGSSTELWIVWESDSNSEDGDGWGIVGRLRSPTGFPTTNDFLVNQTTAGDQRDPIVVGFTEQSFVVAWSGNGQGDSNGIFVREFDTTGVPRSDEQLVNQTTTGTQQFPALRPYGGAYTVAWSGDGAGDDSGIFVRGFGLPGVALPVVTAQLVNDTGSTPQDHLTSDATVRGTVSGPVPIADLEAAFDTGARPIQFHNVTSKLVNGIYRLEPGDLATLLPGGLPDGAYRLLIRARDTNGHLSPNTVLQLILDTHVDTPTLVLQNDTGPSSSDRVTSDPTVIATVVDPNGIDFLFGTLGNGQPSTFVPFTAPPLGSPYVLSTELLRIRNGGSLPAGNYRLRIRALDSAGNFSDVATLEFTLDTNL